MGNGCICPDEARTPDSENQALNFDGLNERGDGAGAASEETESQLVMRSPQGDKEVETRTLSSLRSAVPHEKLGTLAFNRVDELLAAKAPASKMPEYAFNRVDELLAAKAPVPKTPEEVQARLAAPARKETRAKPRRLDPANFLSGLPEVESDIAYRCNLIVIGSSASGIVKAACESSSARNLPGGHALVNQQAQGFRCLCRVESNSEDASDPPLAKLAFHLLEAGANNAQIVSQLEVASTVIVYALTLDERCDAGYLEMQLWEVARVIEHAGLLTGARRKMSRAALICTEGESVSDMSAACNSLLKDFEKKNGRMWMFDLVQLSDANALHITFQRIASRRTLLGSTEEDCGLPEEDCSGTTKADLPAFRVPLELPQRRGPGSTCSESSIATTNGGRPPVFEAELEGSECSETAIELHRKAFALAE